MLSKFICLLHPVEWFPKTNFGRPPSINRIFYFTEIEKLNNQRFVCYFFAFASQCTVNK